MPLAGSEGLSRLGQAGLGLESGGVGHGGVVLAWNSAS